MSFDDHLSRTLRIGDQRIHVRIAGSAGPVVLFCHGFPESSYSWRHQLDALADAGYRAVALDMRGYGRSSKPEDPAAYSVPRLVEDCIGVVHALGESTAVIVGHDFGAPVAWTAAWTHPNVFRAVVGMSVPFSGRGLAALPGDPFGEQRPSTVHTEIAGPGSTFYQDYFADPTRVAENEIEEDLRKWLLSGFYTLSADCPVPEQLSGVDLTNLPYPVLLDFVRATMCVPNGERFGSRLTTPDRLPAWLGEADFERLVAELEQTGVRAPLNCYRNADQAWEELEKFEGDKLVVPALFVGGDRDVATIWSRDATRRAGEHIEDLRGSVIIPNCGHWIQQEHPETVNSELLTFLGRL